VGTIVRCDAGRGPRYGRLAADGEVRFLAAAPWAGGTETGETAALAAVRLLAPCEPSKVVGIGRNYAAHAKELGHELPPAPLVFLKPPTGVIGPGDEIVLPPASREVHHEAELGVVIGRRCRNVDEADAASCIAGYTCVNDVTARDLQRAEVQFTRAKGFDTFCPIGPWIVEELDLSALPVRCRVNGVLRQDGNTRDLIFGIPRLVAFVSSVMTLLPGDVIATGTPAGVGPIATGDRVEIEVGGIGTLSNPVVHAE
jgi:2-keto-4-pentenoate hydratase/2-oxohepta-3-ene-1,7-dioic acid hydratase in catechol pathway